MIEFNVENMTCGHCAGVVNKAIMQLQSDAKVEVDLMAKKIKVSSGLTSDEIIEALEEAGYPASEVKATCCNPQNSCHA
ncbi:heavy-metal-associated domain-containing protein [Shewanella litorisediminis]|uniref:Heavy-metal-associated domain-containing protein n=1 Tax=Shewanella litorisediminis TaxID=1173586 RepID=A0ABX7G878_9GAMM|nr:heavy-metal-associated domain-containing protein [Shewanella litorisediminis]MCL2919347.1 heavy-metal-associated domain-containing protein [Shewanella litorisediminis]QRH03487.1 heavy-metal-associated domain-containing protein [Shewanella litorisediminis]